MLKSIIKHLASVVALAAVAILAGCQTSPQLPPPDAAAQRSSMTLIEGDVLRIDFPAAPNLDTIQTVRRDGKVTVEPAGEIQAAGLTPKQVEDEIIQKAGNMLVDKHVSVTVQTSGFIVYVTGAVQRGGRLVSDHQLTPLQAVIEAGIDMDKGNLKRVTVIREAADGKTQKYQLDLLDTLRGHTAEPFVLQPYDIIYVPEKMSFY